MSGTVEQPPTPSPDARRKRRRWWVLALLLSGGALGVTVAYWTPRTAHPEPPAVELSNADPAVARAVEAARQQVREQPSSAGTWGELGMVLQAHEIYRQAQECYAQAERLDPSDPRWPYLGALCWDKLDPEPVIPCLERAVERCGQEQTPRLRLGEALLEQSRPEEAEAHFRRVREAQPANPRAHLGLGRAAYARGDLPLSLKHLEASAAALSQRRDAHALLASIHHLLGNQEEAAAAGRRAAALRVDAGWPDPYLAQVIARSVGLKADSDRVAALLGEGQVEQALALLQELTKVYPNSAPVRASLGRVLVMQKQAAPAERELREAIRLEPELIGPYYQLGLALNLQGKYAEAVKFFREATRLQPQNAAAHHELGRALLRAGDRKAAVEAFRDTVRYRPNLAAARRQLGMMLAEDGSDAEAIEHLEQALHANPGDQPTRDLLTKLRARSATKKP